ncbi:hypothetical protein [Mesorhizobium sangaii]|uniref:Uncharacterized protein n=1 Tax=Mesorhizobium sangaii TaxID=505389 RepID=A0A841NX56_9HYPH|nr:hypothetical protein [Mesorhizobium sangaii]MBB6407644.1 hypothetical protein [Mesorhizobium sangaii]
MSADLNPDAAVQAAAEFIIKPRPPTGQSTIADIKCRFGLTTAESIEAIRLANKLREAAYAKTS